MKYKDYDAHKYNKQHNSDQSLRTVRRNMEKTYDINFHLWYLFDNRLKLELMNGFIFEKINTPNITIDEYLYDILENTDEFKEYLIQHRDALIDSIT